MPHSFKRNTDIAGRIRLLASRPDWQEQDGIRALKFYSELEMYATLNIYTYICIYIHIYVHIYRCKNSIITHVHIRGQILRIYLSTQHRYIGTPHGRVAVAWYELKRHYPVLSCSRARSFDRCLVSLWFTRRCFVLSTI